MKNSINLNNNSGCALLRTSGTALFILTYSLFLSSVAQAQVSLTGSSYFQDFNGIGAGSPEGWTFWEGATANDAGSEVALKTTPTAWTSTSSGFKNFASGIGLSIDSSSADQSSTLDRAVGVRATGSFGDPGAAFMFSVADTLGFGDFGLSFDAQVLDEESRTTEWTVDYRIGGAEFVPVGTFSLDSFGTQNFSHNFGTSLDNLGESLDFRIATLSDSIGSGSRDTFAIDNFQVSFTPVPEPEEYMLVSGMALALFGVFRKWKQRNQPGVAETT